MVTTRSRDGNNTDPTEQMRRLQDQLERQNQLILQQQEAYLKITEELKQLKEKQRDTTDDHSRNDDEDHTAQNRGPPRSPDLLPFTEAIMQAPMPNRPPPQIEKFDGTTDPEHHLRSFLDSMAFYSSADPVKCRAFSLSLKGEALEWYYALPPNSIDSFRTFAGLLKRQYVSNRKEATTAAELVNLRQEKDEPLRKFMHRYTEVARRVKGVSHEFIITNLPNCLKPGYVSESLYAKLPKTMEELQEKMNKFIMMEDQRHFRRKTDAASAETKHERGRSRDKNRNHRPPQKHAPAPYNPQYNRYAPLTASREKVFEKALQANLISAARRGTPDAADGAKVCRYHGNQGHTTEECRALKDRIEKLIREGHLQEFVQTDARQRDRSPRGARRSPEHTRRNTERSRDQHRERSRSRPQKRDPTPRGRIDTISGGFAGGGASSSARKRHVRSLRSVHNIVRNPLSMPDITFTDEDFHAPDPDQDDPMVITARIAEYDVSKVLIDQGSSVNILYWTTFQKMGLSEDIIAPFGEQIVGFAGERVDTRGYVDLRTRLGTGDRAKELRTRFLLVEAHTSYNALLGRPCLNAFGAIVSTPHLAMKFPSEEGKICTVRADQKIARQCYVASLKDKTYRREKRSEAILVDLDPRTNTDDRIQPQGETK
ncbi:uncharacterized protein LOC106760626 [Vigna radiata var. radiata]|uniref:Uncharacterized protein LOC106760626 n=1 Tax=Vigna radiata var. radiata TaxID=3916 RepID=A0A1S3U0I4_VIGRR|nr:uncharacterized protein LOC106760626 [Vigna radiata var. radiata]